MKFRMGSNVWISHRSQRKTDGKYNRGKIVGIESTSDSLYFVSESDFYRGFEIYRYKVAYIDVFTGRGCSEWFSEMCLSKNKPEDATN